MSEEPKVMCMACRKFHPVGSRHLEYPGSGHIPTRDVWLAWKENEAREMGVELAPELAAEIAERKAAKEEA